jgi:hypothetical protein
VSVENNMRKLMCPFFGTARRKQQNDIKIFSRQDKHEKNVQVHVSVKI